MARSSPDCPARMRCSQEADPESSQAKRSLCFAATCPPINIAGFCLHQAEYKPDHRRALNTTIQNVWSATRKLSQGLATPTLTSAVTSPCTALFARVLPSASGAHHPFPNRGALGHFLGAGATGTLLSHSIQTT